MPRTKAVRKADRALAERILAGDGPAAQALADRLREDLFNLFMWLTRDPAVAEDLTQAAFLQIWEHLPDFRGESSLRTWAHKIAFSALGMHQRRIAREQRAVSMLADMQRAGASDPISRSLEMRIALADALAQLSENERRVVLLCKLQGFTLAEASAILNEPLGTLAWQMAEGVKKLQGLLADWRKQATAQCGSAHAQQAKEVSCDVPQGSRPAGSE